MSNRRFWLGLAVSLLLLGLLLWRIDLRETARSLREANYLFVIPGLVFYFIAVAFRTLRWWLLLLPLRRLPPRRLFRVVVVGYMANNLLPVRLGEVVRSYYVGQREGVSTSAALATIAVERVFDGVTLLFFLVAVSVFLPVAGLVQGLARDIGIPWLLLVVGTTAPFALVLGFLTLVAYRPGWVLGWVAAAIKRLPAGAEVRVMGLAELFVTGLGVLRSPRRLAALFLLSLPVWLAEAAMYYIIGFSFDLSLPLGGVGMMAAAMLAVTATSNLATSLPASQGGIGPFELFAVATLVVLGVQGVIGAAYFFTPPVALLVSCTLPGLRSLLMGEDSLVQLMRMGGRAPGGRNLEAEPTRPEEAP